VPDRLYHAPDLRLRRGRIVVEIDAPRRLPQQPIFGILDVVPSQRWVEPQRRRGAPEPIPDTLPGRAVAIPNRAALHIDRLERIGDIRQREERIGGQVLDLGRAGG